MRLGPGSRASAEAAGALLLRAAEGRITRPGGRFLLLHGDDAPVSDWRARVLRRFQLVRRSVGLCYTEHERTFTQHRTTVFDEFGIPELTAHRRVGERRQ